MILCLTILLLCAGKVGARNVQQDVGYGFHFWRLYWPVLCTQIWPAPFLLTRTKTFGIVKILQSYIVDESLNPGDELPSERIMSEELGVSRFPLREALVQLQALGVISVIHGKGSVHIRV